MIPNSGAQSRQIRHCWEAHSGIPEIRVSRTGGGGVIISATPQVMRTVDESYVTIGLIVQEDDHND